MKKTTLDLDSLDVQSFETGGPERPRRGTVYAAGCTQVASCPCPSHLYQCGDYPETAYSCEYTRDGIACREYTRDEIACKG